MDKKRADDVLSAEDASRVRNELQETNKNDTKVTYNAPDGGYGWVIVAASFFCNCIVDGIVYSFGAFNEILANYFQIDKDTMTFAGSLLSGVYMLAGPLVSAMANKYGCRTVTIAGSFVAAVAFTISTLSPGYQIFFLTYGVMGGLGFGMIYLPAVVFVGYYFEKKRSLATGIAVCGSGFGAFIFAPISEYLLKTFDGQWKGPNLVLACIILLCIIFGALMKPLQFEDASEAELKALNVDPGVHSNLHIDKIAQQPTLPTIIETKTADKHNYNRSLTDINRSRLNSEPDAAHVRNRKLSESGLSKGSRNDLDKNVPVMIRKDIYYSGSIQNLKEFQSQKSLQAYKASNASLNKDARRRSSGLVVATHANDDVDGEKGCLSSIINFSLIKDFVFIMLGISNLFGMAALFVPFFYMPDVAKSQGIENATNLISIIGLTNIFARIACGFLADLPYINSLLLNNLCLTLCAISVTAIASCSTFLAYAFVSVAFGIGLAGYMSLTSIILVDLLGLDKLTDAFGLLILFRGVAVIFGAPIIGKISVAIDVSPFIIAGILFAFSALFSFLSPVVARFKKS